MNTREFAQVARALERIDAGGGPPRLSGAPGAFFRRYAAERAAAARLAIESGVRIRRDGRLSGAALESVTLSPLQPTVTGSVTHTHWGEVGRFLALCPELRTVVLLRTWLSAASGRHGLRTLLALSEGQAAHVIGGFLWSPPGIITTGRADFEVASAGAGTQWSSVPWLKATADDLMASAHPLDFRDVLLAGRPMLIQLRTVLLRPLPEGRAMVPGGFRSRTLTMRLERSHAMPTLDRNRLERSAQPLLALLYRQPWEEDWTAWLAQPADPAAATEHLAAWGRYLRTLQPDWAPGVNLAEAVRRSLVAAGLEPVESAVPDTNIEAPPAATPEARLAFALARAIRVGGSVVA